MSKQSFADLGVSRSIQSALRERGIDEPFEVQKLVIGDVLAGRDVLVQSPTGSGKTLAFGIPLVEALSTEAKRPSALILAPTRELASQIVDELEAICRSRAISITAVYGGVGIQAQAKRASRADILVACPGRLEDLVRRGEITLKHIRYLVIDEADRMLDMGFKPAVDRIVRQTPGDRQTLFFSATLEGEAGRVAGSYTSDPVTRSNRAETSSTRGRLRYEFVSVGRETKVASLLDQLNEPGRGRTLVFVRTKHGADRLVKKITRAPGVKAAAIHGNKSQNQRNRALADFESGKVDTLVATDVAARGIDVAEVTHVINYDIPVDGDTFVHRVGRTARAGADGVGVSFVAEGQEGDMRKIAKSVGLSPEYEAAGIPLDRSTSRPGRERAQGNHQPKRSSGRSRSRGRSRPRS